MTRNLLVQIGLAMSIALTAGTLQAQQDELLADLYGRGVHAYFEGELNTAHKFFSDDIEQKTQDPRCYYFSGATYTRLGRPQQTANLAPGTSVSRNPLSHKNLDVDRNIW